MANWLSKYEQGGLVLKQKTKDNYGKKPNANAGHSTAGPGWIGEGTTNVGFNYNGAWGGTMKDGGSISDPIITNNPKDPRIKKYQDSLALYNKGLRDKQNYINVVKNAGLSTKYLETYGAHTNDKISPISQMGLNNRGGGYDSSNPNDVFTLYGKESEENVKIKDKTPLGQYLEKHPMLYKKPTQPVRYEKLQPKLEYPKVEVKKPAKGTKKFFYNDEEVDEATFNKIVPKKGMAMGGSLPGATGFMYARVGAPSNGKYAKKTLASAEDGKDISKDLKKQAEEFLAKRNANRNTISQYTPKKGEAERLDREKLQRIEESYQPLNRFASSKGAKNLQDAALFAVDVMGALEGVGAAKGLLKKASKFKLSKAATTVEEDAAVKAAANTLSNPVITRGPIPAPYKGTVLPYDNIGYKEPATGELAPYLTPEFESIPYSELPKSIYHGGPKVISDVEAIQVTREGLPIQSATTPTSRGFYATPNTWMHMEGSPNPFRDVEGFYPKLASENAENYAMGRGDAYIHAGEFVENPRIVDWKTFSQMEPVKALNPDFRRLSPEAAKIAEDLGIYGLRDQSEYNILNPQRVFKSFKPTYKNLGKGWEKYKTGGWLNKYK